MMSVIRVLDGLIALFTAAYEGFIALRVAREKKRIEDAYKKLEAAKTKEQAAEALDEISRNF